MVTNRDLKIYNEMIFSYSSAYPAPVYVREQDIRELQILNHNLNSGEVIVISQPLGTEKTVLINYLIANGELDVPVGCSFLTVRNIADNPDCMKEFHGDTLIVNEADIKTPIKKLVNGLNLLSDYLKKSNRKAILIGDYSLKNKNISGKLERIIPLQNYGIMDKDFLSDVLTRRFNFFLNLDGFKIEEVMETVLLDYLAPDWMKTVNTFREVFSLIQGVISCKHYVPYNNEKAFLTLDMFHDFCCKNEQENILFLDEKQRIFFGLLREYIKERYLSGSGITVGITTEELYELVKENGKQRNLQEFSEDILYPFVTAGWLESIGVPKYEGLGSPFVRRPDPYVPSLRLLFSAL